jgi:hypothetical protein
MTRHEYDIPIVRGTFSIRSPRAVALLHPFQLPLVLGLAALAVVFTIWPAALNHTPISFETRGVIHHVWHYSLLAGAVIATVGMFVTHRRRLQIELSGLFLLTGAIVMNLVAVIAQASTIPPTGEEAPSGLGMALRAVVIAGLLVRTYTVVREPTVQIPSIRPNEGR